MTLPNFFIAGVNKAGTTSLFSALATSTDVSVSTTKETGFFLPIRYGRETPPLREYERFFDPKTNARVVLEATPSYFYGGEAIAATLREVSPEGRVLIVLREPAARAFSLWRFARSRLKIPQELGFPEYVERCIELGDAPEHDATAVGWRGLSGGMYSQWLPDWQQVWGDELDVIYYDDLRSDFSGVLRRIAGRLNIEVPNPSASDDNVSTDISSARLQRIALAVNTATERIWRTFPAAKQGLRRAYYSINARKAQERMEDTERKILQEYFAPSISELREILPDVPTSWGVGNH